MKRRHLRGSSYVEFAFAVLVLTPLLLGTTGIGMNLLLAYQTSQLSRDAGHMYARGIDFSQPGDQTVLAGLGSGVGLGATSGILGAAGTGNAVAVFTTVTYVDDAACQRGGYAGTTGVHTSACKNYGQWVFTQRIVVGNSNLKTTDYGSPITTGTSGVTLSSNGSVSVTDQLTNTNDIATFSAINPYNSANGYGLPSGQVIYISEVAAFGFVMPPFQKNPVQYAYNMF